MGLEVCNERFRVYCSGRLHWKSSLRRKLSNGCSKISTKTSPAKLPIKRQHLLTISQSIEIDDDDEEADDDEDEIMIDEERSAPPQRLTSAPPQRMKSEAPEVVRSPGLNDVFDEIKADIDLQGGVVGEAVDAGSESDIEIDEIRSAPRAVKTEPAEPVVIKLVGSAFC